jgi:hypothetical protein
MSAQPIDIQPLTKPTPGQLKYEAYHAHVLKETKHYLLVWDDLHPTVQWQWESVALNDHDPAVDPAARMWDAYAAVMNDPDIPMWPGLLPVHKASWTFLWQCQGTNTPTLRESEAMEELRKIRGYDRTFTKAYDAKEAVFVLREQDKSGYIAIAQWIKTNVERLGASSPKIISAKALMARFMGYANSKNPD